MGPHPPLERAIAQLAAGQHGLVTGAQLIGLGLTSSAIRSRVAAGRLHRVHGGVYAVGHPLLARGGRLMAAVLACGAGGALSHRSAGAHHGLRPDNRAVTDVTSPARAGRKRDGIDVHSGATLLPRDVTTVEGIPTTSVARTLLDLAEVIDRRGLERAIDRAEILRVLDMRAVGDVLRRASGRRGAAPLRAVLSALRVGSTLTRNELEERALSIWRRIGRPPDAVNAWIPFPEGGGAEADFLWRGPRLVVEVDGRATHGTRRAFEHDRRRDQRLMVLGWRVVRFTWRQVSDEPRSVGATVAGLLA